MSHISYKEHPFIIKKKFDLIEEDNIFIIVDSDVNTIIFDIEKKEYKKYIVTNYTEALRIINTTIKNLDDIRNYIVKRMESADNI